MSGRLSCLVCGGRHKARSDKFPRAIYNQHKIIDKKTKKVTGPKEIVVGHACRKCAAKQKKAQ